MKRVLYILLLSFGLLCPTMSQVLMTGHINEKLLKGRVKQVEEFMARFNNEEDWQGAKAGGTADTDTLYRAKYMRTLFDRTRYPLRGGIIDNALAERFIREVIDSGYRINYTDTTWTAELHCRVSRNATERTTTLLLRTHQVAPYEYRWRVEGADTTLLPDIYHRLISPADHENGFMSLLSLQLADNTRIKGIISVCYHFYTIPGYAFTIERIERRNSYNTGWLITSLSAQTR